MSTTTSEPVAKGKPLPWRELIIGSSAVAILGSVLFMPAEADHIGYMLRVTARVAFAFLLLAYIARPLVRLTGSGRWLVRQRRYLGLAMALAHTVHFGYVVAYLVASGEPLDAITAIFGGLAFVLMWAMALTSNNASVRLLGPNWKRLHTFGLHYLWFIFMQTFAGRLFVDDPDLLYVMLIGAGFAALGLRVAAYVSARRTT